MRIKHFDPASLVGADYNPRTIDEEQLRALKKSLQSFGFVDPVIVNKQTGRIVGGHQRVRAAVELGFDKVPVVHVDLDEQDEKALNISLNQISGDWHKEELTKLLSELTGDGFDFRDLGFKESELDDLLDGLPDALDDLTKEEESELKGDLDEIPDLPVDPITKPGDLWQLGKHRLLCGDSTKAEDVARVMDGKRADLCFTDPPYGIADTLSEKNNYDVHDDSEENLENLIAGFFPLAQKYCKVIALTPGVANLWRYKKPDWILCWFYAAGTGRSSWGFTAWQPIMVWGKCPKLSNGEGCHPDGFQFMMNGEDRKDQKELSHACPKPLSVWSRFMKRLQNEKTKIVFEPFSGSGTTMMAAEINNLACYGIEISQAYCDVAVARWEKATGRKALRTPASEVIES